MFCLRSCWSRAALTGRPSEGPQFSLSTSQQHGYYERASFLPPCLPIECMRGLLHVFVARDVALTMTLLTRQWHHRYKRYNTNPRGKFLMQLVSSESFCFEYSATFCHQMCWLIKNCEGHYRPLSSLSEVLTSFNRSGIGRRLRTTWT